MARWMEFYNTGHPYQVIGMEYLTYRFLSGLFDIGKY